MIRATEQFCYLRLDDLGSLMDVRVCKTKELESGLEQEVLPAVVFDEAVAVVGAVVFDDQARLRVVEVGAADEPASGVVESGLDLGMGQPSLSEEPAQAGFHRRLCRRGHLGELSQSARARR